MISRICVRRSIMSVWSVITLSLLEFKCTLTVHLNSATVQAPGGNLEVVSGKVILPGDVAAVLGSHLFLDIAFGGSTTGANAAPWKGNKGRFGHTPMRCSLWSNCAHLEALAYLSFRNKRMELLQPITAEVSGISHAY